MKIYVLVFVFTLFTVYDVSSQSTNAALIAGTNFAAVVDANEPVATNNPSDLSPPPFTTELTRPFAPANLAPLEPKPNELQFGNVRASGIAIEAVKTGKPLSLINPFNPPTNSSAEDNVVRDPFTGKFNGWGVFTIHF
jgi:hypothetical protein